MSRPSRRLREVGQYYALAQVGLEMVLPAALGAILDHYAGISPWGVIGGAILGFVGGLGHMVVLVDRLNKSKRSKDDEEPDTP